MWIRIWFDMEKFDYLNFLVIWFDTKMLNWNWNLVWIIESFFLNFAIWIDFIKKNWIENSQCGTKTQLVKHYLLICPFSSKEKHFIQARRIVCKGIIIYGLVTAEHGIDLVYILVVEFLAFSVFIQTKSFKIQANGVFLVRQLLPYIEGEREPRVRLYWDWICRRGKVCGICCSNCPEACIIKCIMAILYGFRMKLDHLSLNTRQGFPAFLPGTNTLAYYRNRKLWP